MKNPIVKFNLNSKVKLLTSFAASKKLLRMVFVFLLAFASSPLLFGSGLDAFAQQRPGARSFSDLQDSGGRPDWAKFSVFEDGGKIFLCGHHYLN